VIVSGYCFGGAFAIYKITDMISPLRVSGECEELGLDLSEHDEAVGATVVAYLGDDVGIAEVIGRNQGMRVVHRRGLLKRDAARAVSSKSGEAGLQ